MASWHKLVVVVSEPNLDVIAVSILAVFELCSVSSYEYSAFVGSICCLNVGYV